MVHATSWFQSTHPRRVRHGCGPWPPHYQGVSIHAPTKGATNPDMAAACSREFQSTHPRRVRRPRHRRHSTLLLFQSTHPRRVRHSVQRTDATSHIVSIHAPTKGATVSASSSLLAHTLFQSTHPRRVRPAASPPLANSPRFQSTHPRRVRPNAPMDSFVAREFQSTHPRRVRLDVAGSSRGLSSFNPRTHEGCDDEIDVYLDAGIGFNPRTHEGCDPGTPTW